MDRREDPGNPHRFRTNGTDRSKAVRKAESWDGLTGMSAEQAEWEQGLDEEDEED